MKKLIKDLMLILVMAAGIFGAFMLILFDVPIPMWTVIAIMLLIGAMMLKEVYNVKHCQ